MVIEKTSLLMGTTAFKNQDLHAKISTLSTVKINRYVIGLSIK